MTTSLKQRIVGAIFILSLGVILIPLLLDQPRENAEVLSHAIPAAPELPDVSEVSKIHYVFDNTSSVSGEITGDAPSEPSRLLTVADIALDTSETVLQPTPPQEQLAHPTVAATVAVAVPEPPLSAPASELAPAEIKPAIAATATPSLKTMQAHQKAKESLAKATQSQWTIQLGAFSSDKNADALMKKLSAQGFTPYVRKMANDSLVRVYVSPGISRDQATRIAAKLDTELGLKGIVVRYTQ